MNKRCYLYLLTALVSQSSFSADYVGKGFSWYDDPQPEYRQNNSSGKEPMVKKEKELRPIETENKSQPKPKKKTALDELNDFKKKYQNAIAKMYLHPSREAVYEVQKLNKKSLELSGRAADFFRQNLLHHPDINYQATHPIQQEQIHEYDLRLEQQRQQTARNAAKNGYALFYAFKKTDLARDTYSQTVQAFSSEYGFDLLGISMDGSRNKYINEVVNNKNHLNVKITPALILVNPRVKGSLKVIHYGATSAKEIVRSIDFVVNGYRSTDLNIHGEN